MLYAELVRMLIEGDALKFRLRETWNELSHTQRIAFTAAAIAIREGVTDDEAFENATRKNHERSVIRKRAKATALREATVIRKNSEFGARVPDAIVVDDPVEQAQTTPKHVSSVHPVVIPSSAENS